MKKNILSLGLIVIIVAVLIMSVTTFFIIELNRTTTNYQLENTIYLQEKISYIRIVPFLPEDVNIEKIIITYPNYHTDKQIESGKYDNEIERYYIYTDKYFIESDLNNKGMISPLYRVDYVETVLNHNIPVYVMFSTDEITDSTDVIADLTLLIIVNNQVLAFTMREQTSDYNVFYNQYFNEMMTVIDDALSTYLARPIW